jgi:hypothetical protein
LAITPAAPTRVSTWTELGAARPNSRCAVPSGMITLPSSAGWRPTPSSRPDDDVELVADVDGRLVVDRVMWSCSAALGPRSATRSARCEWPSSNSRPDCSWARTARNRPLDAALTGIWNWV